MTKYVVEDFINNIVYGVYDTQEDLIASANYYYHTYCSSDSEYDNSFKVMDYSSALDIFEACGYIIKA